MMGEKEVNEELSGRVVCRPFIEGRCPCKCRNRGGGTLREETVKGRSRW